MLKSMALTSFALGVGLVVGGCAAPTDADTASTSEAIERTEEPPQQEPVQQQDIESVQSDPGQGIPGQQPAMGMMNPGGEEGMQPAEPEGEADETVQFRGGRGGWGRGGGWGGGWGRGGGGWGRGGWGRGWGGGGWGGGGWGVPYAGGVYGVPLYGGVVYGGTCGTTCINGLCSYGCY